jgi:hypothetical protein
VKCCISERATLCSEKLNFNAHKCLISLHNQNGTSFQLTNSICAKGKYSLVHLHQQLILPMIIINTVDFIVNIHCERNTIQTFIADTATKTARVI